MSKNWHRGNGEHRQIISMSPVLRGYPSANDVEAANLWRKFNEGMTPEKKAKKAWRTSARMRRATITLASKPFDHREGS